MKQNPKVVLPLVTLLVGVVAAGGMIVARRAVPAARPERPLPLVRVLRVEPVPVQLSVETRGTVVPRTESELVSEVAGRIIWVSPRLAAGGFVEPDDVLVRIDTQDYEIALSRARAMLARAESELELARANLARQQQLRAGGVDSKAAHETAMNAASVAEAVRDEARAALRQAERDLERTEVRAPFAGRVREKHVDLGQFVARGSAVARIYAVDYAEIRLPIPDSDAAFVDLPIAYRDDDKDEALPEVILKAFFAGREYTWHGQIVRTEGELDPRTRMIHAVARVEDPYGRGDDPDRPPLSVGLFVEARILGRRVDDVYVLPRSALRGESELAVVTEDGQLSLRRVEVLKRDRDTIFVSSGLAPGERICTSPLPISVDEMWVRVVPEDGPGTVHRDGEGVFVAGAIQEESL